MGIISFVGRIMFASVFLVSTWQQLYNEGAIGSSMEEAFRPKLNSLTSHLASLTGLIVPEIDMSYVAAALIAVKGCGGFLFVFGSSLGAYLLLLHLAIATPIFYDFYNYGFDSTQFHQILAKFMEHQVIAVVGALLFFLEMKHYTDIPKTRQHKTGKKRGSKSKRH